MGPKEAVKSEDSSSQAKAANRRRSVACKSCHALKVKCIPSVEDDLLSPCVRCIKTKRICEIETNQTRKKRKNPQISLPENDRVLELEEKIEKLNAELQLHRAQMKNNEASPSEVESNGTKSPANTQPTYSHHYTGGSYQPVMKGQRSSLNESDKSGRGQKRSGFEFVNEGEKLRKKGGDGKQKVRKLTKAEQIEELIKPNALSEVSNVATRVAEDRIRKISSPHIDLIDSGLLTLQEAQERLDLYQNKLFAKYPFVEVPKALEPFRQEYPILFNAVMAVACAADNVSADLDKNLEIENIATKEVIHHIVLIGNKSIEILKATMLLTVYYSMPELFHHRRYHIFSCLCITLTQDLGLTGRPYYVVNKSEGSVQRSAVLEDLQRDEYKCLVMIVYSTSITYSLFLRRKMMVTWTPYLEECYQQLIVSQNKNHRTVAVFSKLSSILEKVHCFVQAQDEENLAFIDHFQRSIDFLKTQETAIDSDVMLGYAYSVESFLYSKFTSVDLSYKCLHSTVKCLHHFSVLTAEQTSYIPHVIYGRLMYAFALFLKTSSYLNYDSDFTSIKRIIATLDECNKTYKTNHLLIKAKLLFYFYLTTYAKNENAFNELANVSSAETAVKAVSASSSLHGTPTSVSSSAPATLNQTTDMEPPAIQPKDSKEGKQKKQNQRSTHQQQQAPQQQQVLQPALQPHPSHIPMQQHNLHHTLQQPIHNQQQSLNQGISMPSQESYNSPSLQFSQQQPLNSLNMPPQHQQYPPAGTPYQQQLNSNHAFQANVPQSGFPVMNQDQVELQPMYPQLDILSEASMKGFGDMPTESMGQDEFWKLFDHKDEQFLL